jgi:hypothetical protein
MTSTAPTSETGRPLRRILGGLLIAYLVLSFGGAAVTGGAPELDAGRASYLKHFVDSSMIAKVTGSYVETIGAIVFVLAALMAARLFRTGTEVSGWLASVIAAMGVLTAAATVTAEAVQMAAVYDGHHGASLATLRALNESGDIAFFVSIGIQGVFLICVGSAALTSRSLPSWLAGLTVAVGLVCLASPLGIGAGTQQLAFMLESALYVVIGIHLLRARRTAAPVPTSRSVVTA